MPDNNYTMRYKPLTCFKLRKQTNFQSKSISVTFYNLPWMDADDSTKTIVKIIIMRAQKALCLNALSFGSMDRATFAMVIKALFFRKIF